MLAVQLFEGHRISAAAALRKLQIGASHVSWVLRRDFTVPALPVRSRVVGPFSKF